MRSGWRRPYRENEPLPSFVLFGHNFNGFIRPGAGVDNATFGGRVATTRGMGKGCPGEALRNATFFKPLQRVVSPDKAFVAALVVHWPIIRATLFLMQWILFALLSAVFAALTAILAKIGVAKVDSNLATAIRTVVVTVFAWGIVLVRGTFRQLPTLDRTSWIFLILSGLATGISWLFYFRALQLGEASKVAPIDKLSLVFTVILAALFLREKVSVMAGVGVAIMTIGALIVGWAR